MGKYIDKIINPEIREIYTRLRIDMNVLSTSKASGNPHNTTCFLCENESETVGHFLLRCSKYRAVRTDFFDAIDKNDSSFKNLNDNKKMCYILDVECPEENVGICCHFISKIYKMRENDNLLRPS